MREGEKVKWGKGGREKYSDRVVGSLVRSFFRSIVH
mgnify:CR=1 FL=1